MLTSSDMFVLHPALQTLLCRFSHSLLLFSFLCSILTGVFFKNPRTITAWFSFYHGGFILVHRRFRDERGEIIPIPALPLSRSNSLTKLSDSILAPTARVNLLCHLQSTRGSAKSRSSPCQKPPTAPPLRSIEVCFLPHFFLFTVTVCLSAYISCFSPFLSQLCVLNPHIHVVYGVLITLRRVI